MDNQEVEKNILSLVVDSLAIILCYIPLKVLDCRLLEVDSLIGFNLMSLSL